MDNKCIFPRACLFSRLPHKLLFLKDNCSGLLDWTNKIKSNPWRTYNKYLRVNKLRSVNSFVLDTHWNILYILQLCLKLTKAIFITINLFFLPPHQACGILISQSGIQPVPLAFGVQSLNRWTAREVPQQIFLSVNVCVHIYTLICVSHIYNICVQICVSPQKVPGVHN